MITRWLVIGLAFLAAGYRVSQGALVEALGLVALGAGLLALKAAPGRPWAKPAAYVCFAVTVVIMVVVFVRDVR